MLWYRLIPLAFVCSFLLSQNSLFSSSISQLSCCWFASRAMQLHYLHWPVQMTVGALNIRDRGILSGVTLLAFSAALSSSTTPTNSRTTISMYAHLDCFDYKKYAPDMHHMKKKAIGLCPPLPHTQTHTVSLPCLFRFSSLLS